MLVEQQVIMRITGYRVVDFGESYSVHYYNPLIPGNQIAVELI